MYVSCFSFTHQRLLAAMQGTNQLVRSNWGVRCLAQGHFDNLGCQMTFIAILEQICSPSGSCMRPIDYKHTPMLSLFLMRFQMVPFGKSIVACDSFLSFIFQHHYIIASLTFIGMTLPSSSC